ncbi:MAG: hypothetical protein Alpg2KO_32420 [Alphaproteobacteria bacterium]
MKRALKWLAIIVVIAFGGGAALIASIDINDYRDDITGQLSKQLGREVAITDKLSLTPGLSPEVSLSGLTVANPDWAEGAHMLEAAEASVNLQLVPLLSRKIEVNQVSLRDVTLRLQRDKDGRANWDLGPAEESAQKPPEPATAPDPEPAAQTGGNIPDLGEMTLRNVTVSVDDKLTNLNETLKIVTARLAAPGTGPLELEMTATRQKLEIRTDLTGGTLSDLLTAIKGGDSTWPLAGHVEMGDSRVTVDGKLTNLSAAPGFDGSASLSIPDGKDLATRLGGLLPEQARPGLSSIRDLSAEGALAGTTVSNLKLNGVIAGVTTALATKDAISLTDPKAAGTLQFDLSTTRLNELGALIGQYAPDLMQPRSNRLQDGLLPIIMPLVQSLKASGKVEIKSLDQIGLKDLDTQVDMIGLALTAKGDVTDLTTDPRTKLALTAKAPDLIKAQPVIDALFPYLPLHLSTDQLKDVDLATRLVLAGGGKARLDDIKASINLFNVDISASGRVTNLIGGPKLDIQASANADSLSGLKPLLIETLPAKAGLFSAGPFSSEVKLKGGLDALALSGIKLDLIAGDDRIKLGGNLTLGHSANLDLVVRGKTLSSLAALAGSNAPAIGPVVIKSGITGQVPEVVSFSGLSIALAKQDIDGDLKLDLTGSRPKLSGDLRGNKIVLGKLTEQAGGPAGGGGSSAGQNSGSGRVLPDFDLPLAALKTINLDLGLAIKALDLGDIKLTAIDSKARISGGVLTVKPLSMTLNGKPVTGQIAVNKGLDVRLDAPGFNYGRLMRQLSVTDLMKGRADVVLRLRGSGNTFRKVLGTANGRLSVVGGKGEVKTELLDRFTAGLLSALFPAGNSGVTVVNCVATKFNISDGVARSETLFLDTERLTATASGKITLAPEHLDLKVRQQASASGLRLPAGAKIRGTLGNPKVDLDAVSAVTDLGSNLLGGEAGALLQGLTGGGSGGGSTDSDQVTDCAVALGKAPAQPTATPQTTAPEADRGNLRQQLQESVPRIRKDDLEDIGKDLLRGLGR